MLLKKKMFPLQPSEDLYAVAPDLDQPPLDHPSTSIIPRDMIPGTDCFDHYLYCPKNPQVGFTISYDDQIMLRDHQHQPNPYSSLPDPFIFGHLTNNIDNKADGDEQIKKKKMIHREIERQRRQEMNTLYATLRSVLPSEFLKGKRAVSDQLNAALDYINCLQKNVKGLNTKKAKLKKMSNEVMGNDRAVDEDQLVTGSCSIAIQPHSSGVEIVVHSGDEEKSLPLYRVIGVLLDEGMDVVSCATTRINDAAVYTIQSEACDLTILDIPRLQRKLNELLITA